MNLSAVSHIEERIAQLSLAEQLWLIERVAQCLREHLGAPSAFDQPLVAMAADQDVQQELQPSEAEGPCGRLHRVGVCPHPKAGGARSRSVRRDDPACTRELL